MVPIFVILRKYIRSVCQCKSIKMCNKTHGSPDVLANIHTYIHTYIRNGRTAGRQSRFGGRSVGGPVKNLRQVLSRRAADAARIPNKRPRPAGGAVTVGRKGWRRIFYFERCDDGRPPQPGVAGVWRQVAYVCQCRKQHRCG